MSTGARVAVGAGLVASLAGNAMAAEATTGARAVAAFAPLALALTVYLLEHDQAPDGPWRWATWGATTSSGDAASPRSSADAIETSMRP